MTLTTAFDLSTPKLTASEFRSFLLVDRDALTSTDIDAPPISVRQYRKALADDKALAYRLAHTN